MEKWVYDLEQFKNFHSATFYNVDTSELKSFVLHQDQNELEEYLRFLAYCESNKVGLIGFNNINYDYPLLHYLLSNKQRLCGMPIWKLVDSLYNEGQKIINAEFSAIKNKLVKIPQLDLFKIHHFDNPAKRTSLKNLQVAMKWHNLQDLPYSYDHYVNKNEIKSILKYNENDVMSTYQFYLETKDKIDFRKRMSKQYNIRCANYPDVKIGEEILIIENAKALGIPIFDLRKMRTEREFIKLEYIILPYVQFKSKEFNKLLDFFKKKTVHAKNTKKVLESSVLYKGVLYDYGLGGVHGISSSGVYKSNSNNKLILVDVDKLASTLNNPVNSVKA